MMRTIMAAIVAIAFAAGSALAAPPDQGSGKNASGHKVKPFAGNPHDRPGSNAKETP